MVRDNRLATEEELEFYSPEDLDTYFPGGGDVYVPPSTPWDPSTPIEPGWSEIIGLSGVRRRVDPEGYARTETGARFAGNLRIFGGDIYDDNGYFGYIGDGQQVYRGSRPPSPAPAVSSPAPPPRNSSQLVTNAYTSLLGRQPDEGGYNFWMSEAERLYDAGWSDQQIAGYLQGQFEGSQEYRDRTTAPSPPAPSPAPVAPLANLLPGDWNSLESAYRNIQYLNENRIPRDQLANYGVTEEGISWLLDNGYTGGASSPAPSPPAPSPAPPAPAPSPYPSSVIGLGGVSRPIDPATGLMYQTEVGGAPMLGWRGGHLGIRNGIIYEGDQPAFGLSGNQMLRALPPEFGPSLERPGVDESTLYTPEARAGWNPPAPSPAPAAPAPTPTTLDRRPDGLLTEEEQESSTTTAPSPPAPSPPSVSIKPFTANGFTQEALDYINRPEVLNSIRAGDAREFIGDDFQLYKKVGESGSSWGGRTITYDVYDPYGNKTDSIEVNESGLEEGLKTAAQLAVMMASIATPGVAGALGSVITNTLGISASAAVNAAIGNTVFQTVMNGGDVGKAVQSTVAQWAGAQVGQVAGGAANNLFGNPTAAKVVADAVNVGVRSLINQQDPTQAVLGSLANSATTFATSQIPNFNNLPESVRGAITSSINLALQGKDVDVGSMLLNATKEGLLSYGLNEIPAFKDADARTQSFISTMLRSAIDQGDLSQTAVNWAIGQAKQELQKVFKVGPALDELKRAGIISDASYYGLDDRTKALVDDFAKQSDPKAAAAKYINSLSTTDEEIRKFYKELTGRDPTDADKDLLARFTGNLDEATARTGLGNQIRADEAADQLRFDKLNTLFQNPDAHDQDLINLMQEYNITPAFIERVTGQKYDKIIADLDARFLTYDEVVDAYREARKASGLDPRDPTPDEILPYIGRNATVLPQIQAATDREATVFDGSKFGSVKDASEAAKNSGYNNFIGPDGKSYMVSSPVVAIQAGSFDGRTFGSVQSANEAARAAGKSSFVGPDEQLYSVLTPQQEGAIKDQVKSTQTFGEAFAKARAQLGPGRTFEWTDPATGVTKSYNTFYGTELYDGSRAGSKMDAAILARNNGAKFFQYDGKIWSIPPGSLDNVGNQSLAETKRLVENNIKAADNDQIRQLQIKAETKKPGDMDGVAGAFANYFGITAQGLGQQIQIFANAYSAITGASFDNAAYKIGKSIENIGDSLVSRSLDQQTAAANKILEQGNSASFLDQPGMLAKAIKENPGWYGSEVLKERVQEIAPWAVTLLGTGVAVAGGVAAAPAIAIGVGLGAITDGLESFGAGAREAYDTLKKAGVPEDEARSIAIRNGVMHALVTTPAEYIADKALFKAYFDNLSNGVKTWALKGLSATAQQALSEYVETVGQGLSTKVNTLDRQMNGGDLREIAMQSIFAASLGGGTTAQMLGEKGLYDAAIVARDKAGQNVTLREFLNGTRDVDLNTLNPNAVIGVNRNGDNVPLGAIVPAAIDQGFVPALFNDVLPSSFTTGNNIVLNRDALGNVTTVADVVSGRVDPSVARTIINDYVDLGLATKTPAPSPSPAPVVAGTTTTAGTGTTTTSGTGATTQTGTGGTATTGTTTAAGTGTTSGTGASTTTTGADMAGLTQQDVLDIVNGVFAKNPQLSIDQVKTIVEQTIAANPGLKMADVSSAITNALSGLPATVSPTEMQTAISNAVSSIKGSQITQADVTNIVNNALAANPGLKLADVQNVVNTAIAGLPAGLSMADVNTAISNALKTLPATVSPTEMKTAIDNAVSSITSTQLTQANVTDIVNSALAANPGLKIADVQNVVNQAIASLPAGLSMDQVNTAITNALKTLPASVTPGEMQTAINTAVSGLGTSVAGQIGDLRNNLTQAIDAAKAQGLQGDAALQKGIDAVAASLGTTRADLLAQLGTTEQGLRTEFASQIGGVQTQVAELGDSLRSAIADARSAGLQGDAALQVGLDSLANRLGTTRTDLLATLGATEQSLRTEFASQLGGVQTQVQQLSTSLQSAIADARAAGLQGDAALQAGLDSLAGSLGTTRADLLSQLGQTEQGLRTEFASQLGGVQTQVTQLGDSLRSAIEAARAEGLQGDSALQAGLDRVAADLGTTRTDLLSQLGTTEQALRTDFAAQLGGVQTQVTQLGTSLQAAVAEARAAGLQGDQALQAGLDKVASDLGTTKADLLSQIGKTETQLRTDLATQLGEVQQQIGQLSQQTQDALAQQSTQTQSQFSQLSAAQQAQADALVQQGQSLTSAINSVQSGLSGQIGALSQQTQDALAQQSAQTQQQFNTLTAAQQAQADALVQQGQSLNSAISQVQSGLTSQISALSTQTQQQLAQQSQQTQQQFNQLTAAQQAQADALVQQGQSLNSAISQVQSGVTTAISNVDTRINQRIDQLVQQGVDQNTATQQAIAEISGQVQTQAQTQADFNTQINNRIDALVQQGMDIRTATNTAINELSTQTQTSIGDLARQTQTSLGNLGTSLTGLGAGLGALGGAFGAYTLQQQQQQQAAQQQAQSAQMRQQAQLLLAEQPQPTGEYYAKFKDPFMTRVTNEKFVSPLEAYLGKIHSPGDFVSAFQSDTTKGQDRIQQEENPMDYFNYGKVQSVDDILRLDQGEPPSPFSFKEGGIVPAFAGGGGLDVVNFAGKPRLDFRNGSAVHGPGDGQSDDIPAMLADGEYVFDAETVSALGNGSTKAGAAALDKMRLAIRKHKRSGSLDSIPPPSKTPLEYLAMANKKGKA